MANPVVLTDARIPGLYRKVCAFAGVPGPPSSARGERFVFRTGAEPPGLYAELLEEAVVEDAAEVAVWSSGATPDYYSLGNGGLAVQAGTGTSCPYEAELRAAVGPGPAVVFAIERRAATGTLLGVTWVATPEIEPAPTADFRAAVLRSDAPRADPAT